MRAPRTINYTLPCFRRTYHRATPSLRSLIRATQADVAHPAGGVIRNHTAEDEIGILGSGSDYTVFIHHTGITSLDTAAVIDPRQTYGQYHSIYDSMTWMERHGDPTFKLHVMMAELWGKMGLRLADAKVSRRSLLCCRVVIGWFAGVDHHHYSPDLTLNLSTFPTPPQLLPLNHTDRARALRSYVTDLEALLAAKNRSRGLDLRPLKAAVALYGDAAALAEEEAAFLRDQAQMQDAAAAPARELSERLAALNDRLAFTERRFLSPPGLPGRPWFKHVGQAPGLHLGYGAESLPGVTQAVNDGKMVLAQEQVLVAAWRVREAALFLAGRADDGAEAGKAQD